jgi:hypothetical protein
MALYAMILFLFHKNAPVSTRNSEFQGSETPVFVQMTARVSGDPERADKKNAVRIIL